MVSRNGFWSWNNVAAADMNRIYFLMLMSILLLALLSPSLLISSRLDDHLHPNVNAKLVNYRQQG